MRTYHIIVGSKSFFDIHIPQVDEYGEPHIDYFLDLVRYSDEQRKLGQHFLDEDRAELLVIKNDNYHGIVESAHDRLGSLIEELTMEDAEIFVHNPPATLKTFLDMQKGQGRINCTYDPEIYTIKRDPDNFATNIYEIEQYIFGQDAAVQDISKSMWYLTNVNRQKPYVIMLYGNSSLGKTELVREIAKHFFENKFLEIHLSMYKNDKYSDYFFGQSPNRRSLGYDLLERKSNLIFLDELDKCPEYFYSAFYTLFDNTVFKDAVYDVDISGTLIILTSNYLNHEEMKGKLGLPIYYRIDKFIQFFDFSAQTIFQITMNEIRDKVSECSGRFSEADIYKAVAPQIQATGENARTIKNKVQMVFEELLFKDVIDRTV